MPAFRILVADDHDVVRQGVRALLQTRPGWEVCGEAATGGEAVEKTEKLRPDIVILDIAMPELNGLEAARLIRKARPEVQILVLTMYESEDLVRELLKVGVRGYVLKTDAGSDLIAATEALSQGKTFLTSGALQGVLKGYLASTTSAEAETPWSRLSGRERETLQLLAEGKTNKEIAFRLGVSIKTVEKHRARIMSKLGLHSISELVRYAIRNKIITP